jgi:hypothetical protein
MAINQEDIGTASDLYAQLLRVCNDNRGLFTFAQLMEAAIDLLVTVIREAEREAPEKAEGTRKIALDIINRVVNDDAIKLKVLHQYEIT